MKKNLTELVSLLDRSGSMQGPEGASIDAAETAGQLGIAPGRAVIYHCDSQGTRLNFEVVGQAVAAVRAVRPWTPTGRTPSRRIFASGRGRRETERPAKSMRGALPTDFAQKKANFFAAGLRRTKYRLHWEKLGKQCRKLRNLDGDGCLI